MLFKDKMIAFIHHSAEKLKLTYQSTLQSIQILNLIDTYAARRVNSFTNGQYSPTLPLAVLSLCSKLHQIKATSVRQLAKLIHPNYRHFDLQQLQKDQQQSQQHTGALSLNQLQQQIKDWQMRVMVWLKWKLSVPLLYDQVLKIAFLWDKYTNFLEHFPLRFEAQSCVSDDDYSSNHNYLASNVCICVYNLSHLIKGTPLQCVSEKSRKLALALFLVVIRKLIKEKLKLKQYILSPRFSVEHMLQDFYSKQFNTQLLHLSSDAQSITHTLQSYKAFKQLSRQKQKIKLKNDKVKKRKATASQKISQQKQNMIYYINLKSKSKQKKRCGSEIGQKSKKNHSRSKKDKQLEIKQVKTYELKQNARLTNQNNRQMKESVKDIKRLPKQIRESSKQLKQSKQHAKQMKDKLRFIKQRGSVLKVNNKKKSNSTKSIVSKNVSSIQKQKMGLQNDLKTVKNSGFAFNRSRASKRSDKSQLNSKIGNNHLEQCCSSKSTYWLRSTTLAKTDKKATISSNLMKFR